MADLFVHECLRDTPLVAIPRPEIQLVVRFGPSARRGLDAHVFGVRQKVHRKLIRAGQWSLTARLRLGASTAVFGVPASALAGRLVGLDALWGAAATEQLYDRLAATRTKPDAAAVVDHAIAERLAGDHVVRAHDELVLEAADRLATASVTTVAAELGLSQRHLRRVFHAAVG
ncbi:MAG: helix-turn-helix transcriptional regulator, partial [Kofleriaceae bacterium]